MSAGSGQPVRERLGAALRLAMRSRDTIAVSALRSAISAIGNAEAVPVDQEPGAGAVEVSSVGVGASDVPRRILSEADVIAIVESEVRERHEAAAELDGLGHEQRADRLRLESAVLLGVLAV